MSEKFERRLAQKIDRDSGLRVPEGYFDNLPTSLMEKLPERKAPEIQKLSRWQKIKPYVYMAAMFAGIWCMMKIFHTATTDPAISLENIPQNIVAVVEDTPAGDFYMYDDETAAMEEYELIDEMSDDYTAIDDFISDFDYTLNKNFENIDLSTYLL